jgi:hypothetical protein
MILIIGNTLLLVFTEITISQIMSSLNFPIAQSTWDCALRGRDLLLMLLRVAVAFFQLALQ